MNPLRSEAEAFRFLLITIVCFALIAVASWIDTWLGVAVWLVVTAVVIGLYWRGRAAREPSQVHVEHDGGEAVRRILVVANETVGGVELHDLLERRAAGYREDVLVVCPALNSRLRTWTSDEDDARRRAQDRLDDSLARLHEAGVTARGAIGDGDPLQAIEDALATFPADEIVISTHPEGRSHWLERGVVRAAEERYDVPVWHVSVFHAEAPFTPEA